MGAKTLAILVKVFDQQTVTTRVLVMHSRRDDTSIAIHWMSLEGRCQVNGSLIDNRRHDLQKCFVSHEERYCKDILRTLYVLLRKLGTHRTNEMAQRMTPKASTQRTRAPSVSLCCLTSECRRVMCFWLIVFQVTLCYQPHFKFRYTSDTDVWIY